jgi:hypothetical protein
VSRLDPDVYAEIARDPLGIPQAFAVVIGASILAGLGQGSPSLVFLWTALAILQWISVSALIWLAGLFAVSNDVDYARLLRCTGFAYAWFALQVCDSLPFVGGLIAWAGTVLFVVSLVLATREVFDISTGRASLICVLAFLVPVLVVSRIVG